VFTQFGATVAQSVGNFLVIGSTLKLMRAGAVHSLTNSSDPLDAADDVDVPQNTAVDVDFGALARLSHLRLGATLKNLRKASFGDPETLTTVRQGRVGAAWFTQPAGGNRGFIFAGDADLTTTPTAVGDVRHIAGGVEAWLAKGRVGLRGGVSGNTVGQSRPAASGGFSIGLTKALHINGSRTIGRDDSLTGWSASVSVTY
jgi:hypothetical protein